MVAAYVCRACRRRLSRPFETVRTASQQQLRRFATDQPDSPLPSTAPEPHQDNETESDPFETAILSNRRIDESDYGLASQSQILKALIRKPTQPTRTQPKKPFEIRRKYGPKEPDYWAEAAAIAERKMLEGVARRERIDAERKAEREARDARFKRDVASKRVSRYLQWGYLRHQVPEEEVLPLRRAFNSWKSKLAYINRRTKTRPPWLNDGKWLWELGSLPLMRAAWEKLDLEERKETWPRVMLSTMVRQPGKSRAVLGATLNPLPPGYAIADTLELIADKLHPTALKDPQNQSQADVFLDLLRQVTRDAPSGHMPMKQATWGLFAQKLSPAHAKELYLLLKSSKVTLHPFTVLHFARNLAGSATEKNYKYAAFDVLKDLAGTGFDLNKPELASVLTALIHCEPSADTEALSFSPADALQYFMERGYTPNVITFTAFINSLCRRREYAEAVRLSKLFSINGLQLDAKAYSTVFRGAKDSLDAHNVRDVLAFAKDTDAPEVEVLGNALHAIFYFAEMEIRQNNLSPASDLKPFLPLLAVYAQRFEMAPLQWLIPDSLPLLLVQKPSDSPESKIRAFDFEQSIVPVVQDHFFDGSGAKLEPNATILATMLRAYIKSLWRPYDLMALYTYLKIRLSERSESTPRAVELLREESTIIHDTLIMAMMDRPGLTRPALEIFGDMLKDHLKSKEPRKMREEWLPTHPKPSVFTFTILLHGLLRNQESNLAEQVKHVMLENQIKPNLVTWNTLIQGYAKMQNIPKTVRALQELEAGGAKPDEHTFKAFGILNDQDEALEMIQQIIENNAKSAESAPPTKVDAAAEHSV